MRLFVSGKPIAVRSGSRKGGLKGWKNRLRDVLIGKQPFPSTCRLRLLFLLESDAIQLANTQNPCGPDLDNLSSPVMDALSGTVLRTAGGDGAIVELLVVKRAVRGREKAGMWITITERPLHS